jgi:tripartite-type tricarboxylate transporter receptor subunit TctC
MITRRALLARSGAAAVLACIGMHSYAQGPKVLRFVIGFPPGVLTDNVTRLIADGLKGSYPAGVIIENKVGAGGRIAAEFAKRAEPDGYTVLLTPVFVMSLYPHVYRNMRYDGLKDFKPVAAVAAFDYAISVGPSVPASVKTLPEFIQWCREDSKRTQYGIPAAGSTPQFIGTLLGKATGVPFTPVPYKGGAPLLQDLLGGQIPAIIDPLPNSIEYHKAGRLRILAVVGAQRSPLVPDVPTVAEYKLDQLAARELFAVYVPTQVPDARVTELSAQIAAAVSNVRDGFARMQVTAESMDSAELGAYTRKDSDRWKSVVEASGFKAED